ncbi:MAG: hypothetical protein CBD98_003715 [Flavobacteriaceae bacterium TMED238]|nr:hypothetical protein [Flavobacteriaceae bacterium]RPG61432.1 MAG: hypothetical protein CBD98_003715 [Flavobacteriaceae bacterium TMED238]
MRKCFSLLFLFFISNVLSQENEYFIDAKFNADNRTIEIYQTIDFTNTTSNNLNYIILNDWAHSYSNPSTPLGKRLSEDFTLNFQRSTKNQRGLTTIYSMQSKSTILSYNRLEDNVDLIKVNLANVLKPNEKITITIDYKIKIPISDFTGYGIDKNGNINLSEWFITLAKIIDDNWLIESNLDLNDISLDPSFYKFKITFPSKFELISDFEIDTINNSDTYNILTSKKEKRIYNPIIISKNRYFEIFKINNNTVITDIDNISNKKTDSLIFKVISYVDKKTGNKILSRPSAKDSVNFKFILNKTINYVESKLGSYPINNIVLSKFDQNKDPIYGLNNIPEFLNPFERSFIQEFSVLKRIISVYLNNLYPIHKRKNYWQIKGIEVFLLIDYIENYYPELNLIGKFSKLSIIKNREYSKFKFNDQYRLFDNIISSRNISQSIDYPLDSLTMINHKVINPYKSGLALKMLDDYLGNKNVMKSIYEFSINNKLISSNRTFIDLLYDNNKGKISWFKDYLNYNNSIDFSIKKVGSKENNHKFLIKNNSLISLPLKITLKDQNNKTENKWLNKFKNDTILNVNSNSKIIINSEKYFSEFNFSNNYSSTSKMKKKTKFVLFRDFDNNLNNQVYYIPIFDYNLYDGLMPGVSFSNSTPIKRPFTYKIEPSYSTKQKEFLGNMNLKYTDYNTNKNNSLYSINYFLGASTFHYKDDLSYNTFFPSVVLAFRDKDLRSNYRQILSMRYISVFREENSNSVEYPNYNILNFKYITANSSVEKAFNFKTDIQINKDFIKSSVTFNFRNYYKTNRQYNVRFFAGKFLKNNTKDDYFSFSSFRARDYLFSTNLLGRSENSGFYSQQYIGSEGGFKSKINYEYANDFIISLNSGITVWQWIEGYSGIAAIKNLNEDLIFQYESGIRLNLFTDYFELYFPVYSSLGNELNQTNYLTKIRFKISLDPDTLSSLFTRRWF